jgi:hypothetical protein
MPLTKIWFKDEKVPVMPVLLPGLELVLAFQQFLRSSDRQTPAWQTEDGGALAVDLSKVLAIEFGSIDGAREFASWWFAGRAQPIVTVCRKAQPVGALLNYLALPQEATPEYFFQHMPEYAFCCDLRQVLGVRVDVQA